MYINSPSYLERITGKMRQKILNIKYGTVFTSKKQNNSNWYYILLIILPISIYVGLYFIQKKINEIEKQNN